MYVNLQRRLNEDIYLNYSPELWVINLFKLLWINK